VNWFGLRISETISNCLFERFFRQKKKLYAIIIYKSSSYEGIRGIFATKRDARTAESDKKSQCLHHKPILTID